MSRHHIALLLTFFGLSAPYLSMGSAKVKLKFEGLELTDTQKKIVTRAAEKVFDRIHQAKVYKCAKRHATRGLPTPKEWDPKMAQFRKAREIDLTISNKVLGKGITGRAQIGSATERNQYKGFENLTIFLNGHYIGYDTFMKRMEKTSQTAKQQMLTEEYWANIIAHEIGHAFGLNHGAGKNWDQDYGGYFITELGACVQNYGSHGTSKKPPKK